MLVEEMMHWRALSTALLYRCNACLEVDKSYQYLAAEYDWEYSSSRLPVLHIVFKVTSLFT